MWLDVRAKLAEIEGNFLTTSATQAPPAVAVSQLSQVSQAPSTANAKPSVVSPQPSDSDAQDILRHGASVTGSPRTWTGRIVSLDAWRALTEWEKHGPNGQHWCGLCRGWHYPTECKGGAT